MNNKSEKKIIRNVWFSFYTDHSVQTAMIQLNRTKSYPFSIFEWLLLPSTIWHCVGNTFGGAFIKRKAYAQDDNLYSRCTLLVFTHREPRMERRFMKWAERKKREVKRRRKRERQSHSAMCHTTQTHWNIIAYQGFDFISFFSFFDSITKNHHIYPNCFEYLEIFLTQSIFTKSKMDIMGEE